MLRRVLPAARLTASVGAWNVVRNFAHDDFCRRHVGPSEAETKEMLSLLGYASIDAMTDDIIPASIRRPPMQHVEALTEAEAIAYHRNLMLRNKVYKSFIGQGYYESVTPAVILRNVLENPNWYTPYTPYQAEISQGRLESLMNWQTAILELTKMEISNASLLDEATAAAEAANLALSAGKREGRNKIYVASTVFKSSTSMIQTRAAIHPGSEIIVGSLADAPLNDPKLAAIVVQTPDATGAVHDFTKLFADAKAKNVLCIVGTDPLASVLCKPVGEMGADVAYGSAQRLGIPLGYGGPSAAFFAVRDEIKRVMPGRLIGLSKDAEGNTAIRMALQTREQHIKREKATSNICTAQALLANMSAFYCVYHGPEGLKGISSKIHSNAKAVAAGLESVGHKVTNSSFFDTITVELKGMTSEEYARKCVERGINVLAVDGHTVRMSMDEATTNGHLQVLLEAGGLKQPCVSTLQKLGAQKAAIPADLERKSPFLQQPVFNTHHSESSMMRYIGRLARKDYGLTHGMIPLGSCTMKLNPAATMLPLSYPEVANMHPYAPEDQTRGYHAMFVELESRLKEATGFAACSLQPNSGAQGEYTGLRVIRAYHDSRGESHRNVCLIPASAHGTNPASAAMADFNIVQVKCTPQGKIDVQDFTEQVNKHAKNLACVMITYPSTYGVFDSDIQVLTKLVHEAGGQAYIDGANLNAMVGLTGPGFFGGDVCHINLHKTFAIPHGGGGPGMGPICVREHLAAFLPNSAFGPKVGGSTPYGVASQAPYGSASILNISYALCLMLGSAGVKLASQYAILNANYLLNKLEPHYHVLFKGDTGRCAHEFIIDLRPFKKSANIEAEDVAKRLMDYGFHAPTLAFPVVGTLMIEPTESEPLSELNRLADALIQIRQEIRDIEEGRQPKEGNVLKHAPHTQAVVTAEKWDRPYTRTMAGYPTKHQREEKYWPTVSRIDGAYGDRNLVCSCAW